MRYIWLILLSACSLPETYFLDYSTYNNNGNLTEEQTAVEMQNVVEFYNACGYPIRITDNAAEADVVISWKDTGPRIIGEQKSNGTIHLSTSKTWVTGDNYACNYTVEDFTSVIAHEIGHSQGFEHVDDFFDIMSKTEGVCLARLYTFYCPGITLPSRDNKYWH